MRLNECGGLAWTWLAALVVVADQISKLAVANTLALHEAIPVTGYFNLVLAHNTGAAFSLFADQPGWQRGFFITVALIAAAIILYLLYRNRGRPLFAAALALVLGGALGNLVDRVLYGHVIDFLDFHLGGWHWPAFNVADSAITLGAALLIRDSFRSHPA